MLCFKTTLIKNNKEFALRNITIVHLTQHTVSFCLLTVNQPTKAGLDHHGLISHQSLLGLAKGSDCVSISKQLTLGGNIILDHE